MNFEVIAQWSEIIGGFAFVAVAIWLFRKYALPAVRSAEVQRNADLVAAEKRRADLLHEVEAARAAHDAAVRESDAIATRAQGDAQREHDAILAEARREGVRLVTNANGEFDRARIAARDALRIEFIEKALLRARELAASEVDDTVNARLVTRTVDDLSGKVH
jgi:F0F1-type ATP synthase membrane subunit b/b'